MDPQFFFGAKGVKEEKICGSKICGSKICGSKIFRSKFGLDQKPNLLAKYNLTQFQHKCNTKQK